jgi:Ca-activated chloride channel homolog
MKSNIPIVPLKGQNRKSASADSSLSPIRGLFPQCVRILLLLAVIIIPIQGRILLPSELKRPLNLLLVEQGNQDYLIKARVDLVVLDTTVTDAEKHFVPNLEKTRFRVFEDGIEQKLSSFSHDDIPVTMGLAIDNSGSMLDKRSQVNAAAVSFVQTSNPEDEVFVVNFNQDVYLDSSDDFTSDSGKLHEALSRIVARGGTSLYDAIVASLEHIKKGRRDKKILLVITDGDDDASRSSFSKMMQMAKESDASIYAIGIFSKEDRRHDRNMVRHSKKELTMLARATGGAAYFPENRDEIEALCTQIAVDIRRQYTLGYYPKNQANDGSFRAVRVRVQPPTGMGKLTVRTRPGYYAR